MRKFALCLLTALSLMPFVSTPLNASTLSSTSFLNFTYPASTGTTAVFNENKPVDPSGMSRADRKQLRKESQMIRRHYRHRRGLVLLCCLLVILIIVLVVVVSA